MSIEENRHIVRLYQEIDNSNDLECLTEALSEDVLTPNIRPAIPYGLEGAKAAHRITLAGFSNHQTIIGDMIAQSHKGSARIRMTGTHTGEFMSIPQTMKRTNFAGIYIGRIARVKIVEQWGRRGCAKSFTPIGCS